MRKGLSRHTYRQAGTALALLLGCSLVLAGCGDGVTSPPSSPVSSSPSASPVLPAGLLSPDRLLVRRTDAFPQNHIKYAFPARVTVTDVAHVRLVAQAVADLPVMPSGAFHCPADLGIVYHLTFFSAGHEEVTASIEATGCQQVKGLGATRWVARSPGFWHVLGAALGLEGPSYATFRGTGP